MCVLRPFGRDDGDGVGEEVKKYKVTRIHSLE